MTRINVGVETVMEQPLVSIVMVNYNHEDYIEEAICSVIAQTYENWELIIVDDGSTDASPKIVEQYSKADSRIKFYPQSSNEHICMATNIGYSYVTGDFVARIDSDDVWCGEKLQKQMEYMEKHPEGDLCFTKLDIIDEDGKNINQSSQVLYDIYNTRQTDKKGWIRHFFYYGNTLIQSTLLMKREVLDVIGGFNPIYVQSHDFDFFTRAIMKYDFIFLEEPLVKYRRIDKQNSAWNEKNNVRFFNEHMNIRYHFFDQMPDELFRESFGNDFVNPDSDSHEEFLCEQAFLLCRCIRGEDINPVLGLIKLGELLQNSELKDVLKEKFHYTQKDFYEQTVRRLFVTEDISGELGYLRRLCPMLEGRVQELEGENESLRKSLGKKQGLLDQIENSRSWKLTEPLRKMKKILDK